MLQTVRQGQKLILAYLLNINDVSQFNDFVPLGVGAFETKVTGEINESQLKCSQNKTHTALMQVCLWWVLNFIALCHGFGAITEMLRRWQHRVSQRLILGISSSGSSSAIKLGLTSPWHRGRRYGCNLLEFSGLCWWGSSASHSHTLVQYYRKKVKAVKICWVLNRD